MAEVSNRTVVRTEGLSKSYKGVDALKGLDLDVSEHSIFGFLGPNGAGKTTTIKLLLGLARPTAGTATVFGRDIVEDSLEIRRKIGYLAQDPRYYDHMTARETLRFRAGAGRPCRRSPGPSVAARPPAAGPGPVYAGSSTTTTEGRRWGGGMTEPRRALRGQISTKSTVGPPPARRKQGAIDISYHECI